MKANVELSKDTYLQTYKEMKSMANVPYQSMVGCFVPNLILPLQMVPLINT